MADKDEVGYWANALICPLISVGIALGLAWSAPEVRGSEFVTHAGDYIIQNWQIEQGLPQISITSIAQTPDGYLWVGTFNGLVRFDGVRFTVFNEGNTPALGNSGITYLQVDAHGALWIVTLAGGLVRMAGGQFTLILENEAQALLGSNDPSLRLLLVDRDGGWRRIDRDQLLPLESPGPLGSNAPPGFLFVNACGSWIEEQGRIIPSPRRTFPVFIATGTNRHRNDLIIHSAAHSQAGGYWVATSNGVYRLLQGQLSSRVAPLPTAVHEQLSMQEDGRGTLWAGKWAEGIFCLDAQGAWQQFSVGTGLSDNHVNCLFRDREGSLWVGTGQGGLHRIRPRVFQTYHTEGGPNVVTSVTQDRQGRMWFGVNGGGLHTWVDGKLRPVAEPIILRSYPLAYSVLADRQDAVWIGLYGLKVLRWHTGTVTPYDLNDGSGKVMTPSALFEDHAGTIWLGCAQSLFRYERGRLTRYTTRDGLSSDAVVALAEDRSGALYIGTDGGGLNCLRQGKFTRFLEGDGLADNHLTSLYLDREDNLWIGTVNGGLSRFKHGRFDTAGVKAGLPTDIIGNLLEDDFGNLWLGSNRGIIRVNRQALNDYLDGKLASVDWHVFGISDGLSTLGCVGNSQPAFCKAQDGKLWFSTIKGVAVVDPKQIPFNRLPPPVAIEEVTLDDSVHARPLSNLAVPPHTHRVEFRFTGLSLMASEKVRFRYRLEPFDRGWIEAGTRRIAYYSGVRPGNYQFHVTACNNDGVWNEAGAVLGVTILPPWWMTWWFRGTLIVSAVGLVFGWYELRLHRLHRARLAQESFSRRLLASQENERRRIAGDLHDGLGQNLVLIRNRAELSLRQHQPAPGLAEQLREISITAAQSIEDVRATAHALRPYELERLGLTQAIQDAAQKAAETSSVKFSCDLERIEGVLTPEAEMALFRILQGGISNVLRHAHAKEVIIEVKREGDDIRMTILDNGRGFEFTGGETELATNAGFGLTNIGARARMLGGALHLKSAPGRGTSLTVHLPINTKLS